MRDESIATRNLANIVYRLGGGKTNFDNIWPIEGKEKDVIVPTKEWIEKIKKSQVAIDLEIAKRRMNKK